MSKKKSSNVDALQAPTFQPNPNVTPNISFLSDVGTGLASGDFLNPNDPLLGFLNQLVTPNNDLVQAQLGLASRDVINFRDDAQQSIINQLEANNQLTSSVTGNKLSDLNEAFSSDISDIATNFYLADVERALGNISGLFELGLNTTGQATNLGLGDQQQRNSFALQNFSNQLALASLKDQNANSGRGGLFGGAIGTGLGAAIGSVVPGVGTAIGAGIGGAIGGGLGEAISPSQTGAGAGGFISGGLGLSGAGFANNSGFQPTNRFGGGDFNAASGLRLALQDAQAVSQFGSFQDKLLFGKV